MDFNNTESFITSSPDITTHRVPRVHYDVPRVLDTLNIAIDYDNARQISPNQSTFNTNSNSNESEFIPEGSPIRSYPRNAIPKDFPVDSLDHSTPVKTFTNRNIGAGVPQHNASQPDTPFSRIERKQPSNLVWRSEASSLGSAIDHPSNYEPSREQPVSKSDYRPNDDQYTFLRHDSLSEANLDLESSTIRLVLGDAGTLAASPGTTPPSSGGTDRNMPEELNFQDNLPEILPENLRNLDFPNSGIRNSHLQTRQAHPTSGRIELSRQVDGNKTAGNSIIEQQARTIQDQGEKIRALEERLTKFIESKDNNVVDSRLAQFGTQNQTETHSLKEVSEDTLPGDFKKYYKSLGLNRVDELSELQCKNTIKNIMLSLLVTDFEHLPQKMQQLGLYIEHTANFVDDVHQALYGSMETNPLDYLLKPDQDVNKGFEECLAGMTSLVLQHMDNSKKSGQ